MLATILYIALLLCTFGGSAFNMGNIRMQTTVTRYCNLDLVDADGKPVNCHISNSMETMGLVLPGMDDGKSLTTRQDIFLTKDGQLTVEASPGRPYEYIVIANTISESYMLQLFDEKSFYVPLHFAREGLESVGNQLTLEDHGWVHHGLVYMDGETLNKRVIARLNGTDPKTGMNYTALAMTGLIPNCWILYTNENDTRIVKLLATNTLHNDTVFQETIVTHWEELHENMTANDTLQLVYSSYHIEKHEEYTSSPTADPLPDVSFMESEITGEVTREFFRDAKNPDWMPSNQLRGSNGTATRIDYFKILPGTASYMFFHAQSSYAEDGGTKKFELPKECTTNFITSKSPYCLYVNYNVNDTLLALDFFMGLQDVSQMENNAHLNISVYYSREESVLDLSFVGDGCAVVWQAGVSFANLNIAVCISGSGAGKSLLQPDNATYRGAAAISVSFNIKVPIVPTIRVKLEAGLKVEGAPHNNITASAYLKLSTKLVVVGADMWVEIFGNTVNKINTWQFESFFNLKVWVNILLWKHDWTWTWPLFKAGPVVF